jgi:hypothetical protein
MKFATASGSDDGTIRGWRSPVARGRHLLRRHRAVQRALTVTTGRQEDNRIAVSVCDFDSHPPPAA